MKRRCFILTLTVFSLFLLVGCSPQSVEEAQVEFCQALAAYGQSVQALQEIDAQTTVDELEAARDNAADARQAVADTAVDLREAQVRRAEQAWEETQSAIDDIPGDASLGQAAATVRGRALILATEIERIRNVSCGRR